MTTTTPPTFEVGLVLAGAVSGGAYQAGVLDFLLEALAAFHATHPPWRVRLRVVAGASAGAINGLLLAKSLARGRGHRHVTHADTPPAPGDNLLFDAWGRCMPTLAALSRHPGQPVTGGQSLLNYTPVEAALADLLANPETSRPDTTDDVPCLAISLAHLLGVETPVWFQAAAGRRVAFQLRYHAVSQTTCSPLAWRQLAEMALASAAFPLVFPPRFLTLPQTSGWFVDGGVVNNEPIDMALDSLFGPGEEAEQLDGLRTRRALILIDPFPTLGSDTPSDISQQTSQPPPWGHQLKALVALWLNQSRYRPGVLQAALADDVATRYLVAPTLTRRHPTRLACAQWFGFGGFVDPRLAVADFMLGRAHAQEFLAEGWRLPPQNPLFAQSPTGSPGHHRPVLPLCGTAAQPVALPPWPVVLERQWRHARTCLEDSATHLLVDQLGIRPTPTGGLNRWLVRWGVRTALRRLLPSP